MDDKWITWEKGSEPDFTTRGELVKVTLPNGKKTLGKVISCHGRFADVLVNGKKYLINSGGVVQ